MCQLRNKCGVIVCQAWRDGSKFTFYLVPLWIQLVRLTFINAGLEFPYRKRILLPEKRTLSLFRFNERSLFRLLTLDIQACEVKALSHRTAFSIFKKWMKKRKQSTVVALSWLQRAQCCPWFWMLNVLTVTLSNNNKDLVLFFCAGARQSCLETSLKTYQTLT